MDTTYKPLPDAYRKNGYDYTLLHRTARTALYQQSSADAPGWHAYEVCRVLRHEGRTIATQAVPPAEYLPGAEQWGQQAWTFRTLAAAEAKFHQQDARTLAPAPAHA